jgi:hypothetical protein
MHRGRSTWLGLLLTLAWVGGARAGESYFVLVFGSQRPELNRPNFTHTYATFVKVLEDDSCPNACSLEAVTISWMPQSLKVQTYHLLPEPGVNLDLRTTLEWARQSKLRTSVWGPYQIKKELYQDAVQQVTRLQSGAVRYKTIDTGYPCRRVSNCIHAVSDLVLREHRLRIGTPSWGEGASYLVTLAMHPWIIDPDRTHDWVLEALELSRHPLVRRNLDRSPSHGPLLRATQSLFRLWLEHAQGGCR